jgi:hypothetical protein
LRVQRTLHGATEGQDMTHTGPFSSRSNVFGMD